MISCASSSKNPKASTAAQMTAIIMAKAFRSVPFRNWKAAQAAIMSRMIIAAIRASPRLICYKLLSLLFWFFPCRSGFFSGKDPDHFVNSGSASDNFFHGVFLQVSHFGPFESRVDIGGGF